MYMAAVGYTNHSAFLADLPMLIRCLQNVLYWHSNCLP